MLDPIILWMMSQTQVLPHSQLPSRHGQRIHHWNSTTKRKSRKNPSTTSTNNQNRRKRMISTHLQPLPPNLSRRPLTSPRSMISRCDCILYQWWSYYGLQSYGQLASARWHCQAKSQNGSGTGSFGNQHDAVLQGTKPNKQCRNSMHKLPTSAVTFP